MGKKTKRQQPRPKRKKYTATASKGLRTQKELFKAIGKKMMAFLKDKEGLGNIIQEHIGCIEGYFRRYDSIQLLGSVGLFLINNLPNLEKYFMAGIAGKQLELDEEAEVIQRASTSASELDLMRQLPYLFIFLRLQIYIKFLRL